MKIKTIIAISFMVTSLSIYSQEKQDLNPKGGEFGFIGYTSGNNGSIGLIYNVGSIFALSPSFLAFQKESMIKDYSVSLELQWHYIISNNFSAFVGVAPMYSYHYSGGNTGVVGYENTTHDFTGKILFGARYMVTDRLAIFANIGASYTAERYIYKEFDTSGNKINERNRLYETGQTESANIGVIFYIVK